MSDESKDEASTEAHEGPEALETSSEERATIRAQRLDRLAELRDGGVTPYPYRFERS